MDEELKNLLDKTLEDESGADNDYGDMIEYIMNSSLSDSLKVLATTLIEKIQTDEQTHYEMLSNLRDVVKMNI